MQNAKSQFKIQKFKILKNELPQIQQNVSLKNYTTFKIGGKAEYFFVAKNKEDLIKAILVSKKLKIPFFILGGGSNLLVSDEGFKGLIIKFQNPKSKIQIKSKVQNPNIYVEAGVSLSLVVSKAVQNNLTGLEWAVGIPGTVGGAVRGNAGAFGKSMVEIVREVEVLEVKNEKLKVKNLRNKDCRFGYRESIFKKNKNLIILSTILQLKKENESEIKEKIKKYLNYRKRTQPLEFPSVGSIFKNPKSKIQNPNLLKQFPELREFNRKSEIPAGWLIEKCGLKGRQIGKVKFSEKHANFIINLGKGKAKDVMELINLAKREVKKKFDIDLESEICFLGF